MLKSEVKLGQRFLIAAVVLDHADARGQLVRAALNGGGMALPPQFATAEAINNGRLIQLLPDAEVETLGVFAVYLSRQRMPSTLRALIDFLATNLRSPAADPG